MCTHSQQYGCRNIIQKGDRPSPIAPPQSHYYSCQPIIQKRDKFVLRPGTSRSSSERAECGPRLIQSVQAQPADPGALHQCKCMVDLRREAHDPQGGARPGCADHQDQGMLDEGKQDAAGALSGMLFGGLQYSNPQHMHRQMLNAASNLLSDDRCYPGCCECTAIASLMSALSTHVHF